MDGLVELKRLLHNIVRLGIIADVDPATARARLRDGDLRTDWRPWLELRAGTTRTWNPPTVGEQAILLSAGGDPADSVILTGLFSDAHPAPADDPSLDRKDYPDGAVIEYNHETHRLRAETGPSSILMDRDHIALASNGSTLTLDASGIVLNGSRIDLNP